MQTSMMKNSMELRDLCEFAGWHIAFVVADNLSSLSKSVLGSPLQVQLQSGAKLSVDLEESENNSGLSSSSSMSILLLLAGQTVQVHRVSGDGSTAAPLVTDRVRLQETRLTALLKAKTGRKYVQSGYDQAELLHSRERHRDHRGCFACQFRRRCQCGGTGRTTGAGYCLRTGAGCSSSRPPVRHSWLRARCVSTNWILQQLSHLRAA